MVVTTDVSYMEAKSQTTSGPVIYTWHRFHFLNHWTVGYRNKGLQLFQYPAIRVVLEVDTQVVHGLLWRDLGRTWTHLLSHFPRPVPGVHRAESTASLISFFVKMKRLLGIVTCDWFFCRNLQPSPPYQLFSSPLFFFLCGVWGGGMGGYLGIYLVLKSSKV